ncbi:aspartate ammonia-lyase [Peribacillus muralis]|uniref:lyase family protein n=1 Tax=Peribacillus muralis TaxID=264697 RepID=UPI001F4D6CC6|nr:lyase family protein [Peribacillus muralis]MCK1993257.1 lyase family protein [Peribacillus muralis]MCK2013811.1 lyase family protein [Peribacillus muralis]
MEKRTERDNFGEVNIPLKALYGIQTWRTATNLSFSGQLLKEYPEYIVSLAMVKKAAALANLEAGLLSPSDGNAIVNACNQLIQGHYHDHFIVDILHGGGGIGTNMNVNEVLANLANETLVGTIGTYAPIHPIEHVNASQSTSDVCHTAIRLAIVSSFERLDHELTKMHVTLREKSQEFMGVTTISRTCLQDAMRIQLGEVFSGFASVIKRRHHSLNESVMSLLTVNLGATVIGNGIGASEIYRAVVIPKLQEVTNMNVTLRENLFDAAQNIDDLAHMSTQLSLLATSLIKVAKDLRLLSSGPEAGFSEIIMPSVQAGSSFFPGKVNPVIPETMIQSCFQVLGCDRVVQAALEHGELDLNVFEGMAGANILNGLYMLANSAKSFTELCLKGITSNEERCRELSDTFIPVITELKERMGYSAVAKLMAEEDRETIKNLLK